MNKAFEAVLSILGDGWEKWSVPHSQQDLWKSFQPARCTYNLQPDLRESFSADVCTDINFASLGVVIGQYSDVQWGRSGGLRLDNDCGGRAQFTRSVGGRRGGKKVSVNIAAILDVESPQTPTSPNQQKIARRTDILSNRSIGCPCTRASVLISRRV